MRLGGNCFGDTSSPEKWLEALKGYGYSASYCPVGLNATDSEISEYKQAALENDIIIAEVGAWSNPISKDYDICEDAMEKCKKALLLADKIGANCCVNISGSRGSKWDSPCPEDLTPETFDMVVKCVQEIIDDVQPENTFYTLEPMPWMYPDSPDSYLELVKAIDRKAFAVHFDVVNLINCPQRSFRNKDLIKEFTGKLGKYIKSCHAKDSLLHKTLTVRLDEARPGEGNVDYSTLLKELEILSPDMTLMIEHLPNEQEFILAGDYIRRIAKINNIIIK